jgi:DNA-binding NtrC family response regulator
MRDITVLFVDDEKNVLSSLEYNLVREPYKKLFAENASLALAMLEKEPVHVIVSDMRMPGMDGLAFLTKVKEQYPEIVRLILSAFTDVPKMIASINTGEIFRYLTKPIEDPAQFRKTVNDAIDYYLLRRDREELITALKQKNRELEEALANVKRLEGLIPICCYCKKIRDDRNYWEDVERYVSEHSSARFSHGICPECMKKHVEPMLDGYSGKNDSPGK